MPVRITRPYTRTGDDGSTGLGDFSRTSKTDPRLAAYADADEAGAVIGLAVTLGDLDDDVRTLLLRVQNDLFDVGADLCMPLADTYEYEPLRVQEPWIGELETEIDRYNEHLGKLTTFVLAGGTPGVGVPAPRPHRGAAGRADGLGRRGGVRHRHRRRREPAGRAVPQPAVGPAVRPGPVRQPRDRRRAVAARRRPRPAARD